MNTISKHAVLVATSVIFLFAGSFFKPICAQTKPPAKYQNIKAHLGNITCTFRMKLDKQRYSTEESDLSWGLANTKEYFDAVNYRCVALDITVGKQKLDVNDDVYMPFSNIDTVSITRSRMVKQFAIHIAGGDAASGYWSTINFKLIKSIHDYEPVSRVIRSGEFPDQYYEICTYHLWVSHTM